MVRSVFLAPTFKIYTATKVSVHHCNDADAYDGRLEAYFASEFSYPTHGMKRKEWEISFGGIEEKIMHEEWTLDWSQSKIGYLLFCNCCRFHTTVRWFVIRAFDFIIRFVWASYTVHSQFLPRDPLRLHVVRLSVRPSKFQPSVTLVDQDHIHIRWKSWKLIARTISVTSSLFVVPHVPPGWWMAFAPKAIHHPPWGNFWGE